jgi:hypothetical protein
MACYLARNFVAKRDKFWLDLKNLFDDRKFGGTSP